MKRELVLFFFPKNKKSDYFGMWICQWNIPENVCITTWIRNKSKMNENVTILTITILTIVTILFKIHTQ